MNFNISTLMKQILVVLFGTLLSALPFPAGSQSVEFHKQWIEHGVVQNGVKGMMLHFDFTTHGLLNKKCNLAVYVESPKGTPVKDMNGKYRDTGGNVATSEELTPIYEHSHYSDFKIFMPNDEVHMKSGKHTYYVKARLYHDDEFLDGRVYLSFVGTNGSNSGANHNHYANQQSKKASNVSRADLPGGGYSEYIRNEDGSITSNQFMVCSVCCGSGTCIGCGGAGGRFLYGVYYPCTMCMGNVGKCRACQGRGGVYSTMVIGKDGSVSGSDSYGTRYTKMNGQVVGIGANGQIFTGDMGNGNDNGSGSGSGTRGSSSGSPSNSDRYGNITCHICHGTGVCPTCGGDKIVDNPYGGSYICTSCDKGRCRRCGGTGKVYGLKSIEGKGWK